MNLYERDIKALRTLYGLLPVGKPTDNINNETIAELAGLTVSQVRDVAKVAEHLGIFTREMHYPPAVKGRIQGRRWKWTLLMPEGDAIALYTDKVYNGDTSLSRRLIAPADLHIEERVTASAAKGNHASVKNKPRGITGQSAELPAKVEVAKLPASTAAFTNPEAVGKKAVTLSDNGETRAIAGPEAANPFAVIRSIRKPTDAQALVEAARQYRNRENDLRNAIDAMIATADKHNIVMDRESIEASAKYRIDPEMEPIAKVLPFIDSLEATVARQANQIVELRHRTEGYDAMRIEKNRLAKANERLIAQRVGQSLRES